MSDFYFKFYGQNFRDGVRGLKADVVGVYILTLTLIYDAGGVIPDDDAWVASKIGFDIRVWKRCRTELIKARKLRASGGKLSNAKADDVLADRDRVSEVRREAGKTGGKAPRRTGKKNRFSETSPELLPNFSEKSQRSFSKDHSEPIENTEKSPSKCSQLELESEYSSTADKSAAELAPPPTRPFDRCVAIAGPGLADPAKHPSLHLSAHRIAAAITAGCDLELDILPVIAARTAQPRASPISTWSYFDRAWADARDARLAGFAPTDTSRFEGAEHAKHHRDNGKRRGTGSLVDAAVRLIDRARAFDGHEPDAELLEGEIAHPRRVGAG